VGGERDASFTTKSNECHTINGGADKAMDTFSFLLGNIVSAVIGLIIGRIFDKPFERWQRKTGYHVRRIVSRFRASSRDSLSFEEFRIGKWQADWVVVEGSSSDPYTSDNIICRFDPTPLLLPTDRQQKKAQIETTQASIEQARGSREFHNGQVVALAGIGSGQFGEMEAPVLIVRLRPSDYYTYLATAVSLDEVIQTDDGKRITVRDKYLKRMHYASPKPEFASAFPINLTVITCDGYILISKRATEGISGYAGYIFPAINECMNPLSDRSANGNLSVFATAQRAANHELNIEIEEDELVFFTLGVDTRWYYYGLTGSIRSKTYTKDDILARRSIGSKERWESKELFFLPHNAEEIARFMRKTSATEKWGPIGVVCLVQTMIAEFGVKETERVLRKYPPLKI
jgi:hypothetical protein